jgi:repressor LexA
MYIAGNIRHLRKKAGLSQDELAEMLGYSSFTTIQKWESGVSTPPVGIFARMAEIFGVDLDDFARRDMSAPGFRSKGSVVSVPVYGKIPAGQPLESIEDIDGHAALSEELACTGKEYFALRISGRSMHPKYEDGDIVIFEQSKVCENGDDCAVRVHGEDATFKKIKKLDQGIILQPVNPEYDPIQIDDTSSALSAEILGIAREIRRKV